MLNKKGNKYETTVPGLSSLLASLVYHNTSFHAVENVNIQKISDF